MSKKQSLVTVLIGLCSFVIGFFFNLNLSQALTILTGNYFIDALFEFMVTAPVLIPVLVLLSLFGVIRRKEWLTRFLIYLASAYVILTLIYLVSQFTLPLLPFLYDQPFQYIRSSVGAAFLAALCSLLAYFKVQNIILRFFLLFGALLPVALLVFIPLSLKYNGISWSHFGD